MRTTALALLLLVSIPSYAGASKKEKHSDSLDSYLAKVRFAPTSTYTERTPGSLWIDSGPLSESISDHRARSVGDLVTIEVMELTSAQSSASVNTQRKFDASSGVTALGGKINTSGIESLFSPYSTQNLQGKGQTASDSKLQTTLSGRIVAILPSGALVLEATRDVLMNNQRNRIIVRGVARLADISAEDSIVSTRLSDLEVELAGKGVVSDGTRQPNFAVRWLLRLLNF
jgi:flagellar L-ring protein precursor FlgH